eukprot:jgi/Psemu1/21433/gm1.21433_g
MNTPLEQANMMRARKKQMYSFKKNEDDVGSLAESYASMDITNQSNGRSKAHRNVHVDANADTNKQSRSSHAGGLLASCLDLACSLSDLGESLGQDLHNPSGCAAIKRMGVAGGLEVVVDPT